MSARRDVGAALKRRIKQWKENARKLVHKFKKTRRKIMQLETTINRLIKYLNRRKKNCQQL